MIDRMSVPIVTGSPIDLGEIGGLEYLANRFSFGRTPAGKSEVFYGIHKPIPFVEIFRQYQTYGTNGNCKI